MQGDRSFLDSLRVQLRVLGALSMREIVTRFGRDQIGFWWLFVEPMILTVGVTALWSVFHTLTPVPIAAFAVSGYSMVLLWRSTVSSCIWAVPANTALLHHRNVKVLDLFISRILVEVAGATISFFLLSAAYIFLGLMAPPVDLMNILVGWLALSWFTAGWALCWGAASTYGELVRIAWTPLGYFFFPICGAAYMVEWLPSRLQALALWVPTVHGVEMMRAGIWGGGVRTHYDIWFLLASCMIVTLLGLVLARGAAFRVDNL